MIINKITTGFVIQTFDTEKKQYTKQEFIAGDPVTYEDIEGDLADSSVMAVNPDGSEPYLPFDMIQPEKQ